MIGVQSVDFERLSDLQISFPVPGEGLLGPQLHLSTEVQIIPEALPFPPCQSVACYGTLV